MHFMLGEISRGPSTSHRPRDNRRLVPEHTLNRTNRTHLYKDI